MLDIENDILAAESNIRPLVLKTPLKYSTLLSKISGANVFLKCEHLQHTGSFKIRGALNKLLKLNPAQRAEGIIAASSGNHGAAVAFGLQKLQIPGTIFVPENTAESKVSNIRRYNASLKFYGNDCVITELHARKYASQNNKTYISPYNDLEVISGQGTLGLEMHTQLDKIDSVFLPVGGGGLIAGVAAYLKTNSPHTEIIGCLPENSPVMAKSVEAGHIIEMPIKPTVCDATAGGIEPESITFQFCKKLVDRYFLASEAKIEKSMITLLETEKLLVEGAAGVALAAFLDNVEMFQNKNVIILLSGGNIDPNYLNK